MSRLPRPSGRPRLAVALAVTLGSPRAGPAAAPPASADAAAGNPVDARQLHRLRLRPVPGADPEGDERLAQELAVPRGRHLHLRHSRGPAATSRTSRPTWVSTQLAQGLAAAADHARPAGRLPARASRATTTTSTINPTPGRRQVVRRGAAAGPRRGRRRRWPTRRRSGIVAGSTLWYDLEGFDLDNTHCRESALRFLSGWTDPAARARLRLRRLLHASAPASRCSTTPGSSGPA